MKQRIGIGSLGDQSIKVVIDYSILAEEKGFHSIWLAEDYYFRDAFTTMAAVAAKTHRISLASGVINPYTRHPALTAMTLASANQLAGDRIILGIGTGVKQNIEGQMGITMGNRLTVMREYVQVVRAILRGEKVSLNGSYFKIVDVSLNALPPVPHLPVYMAAVGPKMLQLAGEIGDGVLMTAGNSPAYVRYALNHLQDGAKKSGRTMSDFDVAAYIFYAMDENSDTARDVARRMVAFVLSPLEYGDLMCEISGFDPKVLIPVRKALQAGLVDEAGRSITDEMVDAFSVSGTPKECRLKLRTYLDAGIKLPVIMPVTRNFNEVIESLSEEY